MTTIACTEPIATLPRPQFSQEIIILQALRVIYYMDRGRTNYLPWTSLRMYDWLKSKVAGFNIITADDNIAAYCCDHLDGKLFIGLQDFERIDNLDWDAYRTWGGIMGEITLYGHEGRHVDGFPHASCCPGGSGFCDQTYDESNLSAIGVQDWLSRAFINGVINVFANCLPGNIVVKYSQLEVDALQRYDQNAFCDAKPPLAVLPDVPFGVCPYRSLTSSLKPPGITNAASYRDSRIAPGELITVFAPGVDASGLSTFQLDLSGKLPTTLADTRVYVNGVPSPLIYVAQDQLSAIVPYSTPAPSAYVEIENRGRLTNYLKVLVVPVEPGLFSNDGSGKGQVVALNEDGALNAPSNPAARGSIVVLYGTGGGITNPGSIDGSVNATPLPVLQAQTRVFISGREATVLYGGPAPGLVSGVLQINVRIPAELAANAAAPIQLIIGNNGATQNTTIAVR